MTSSSTRAKTASRRSNGQYQSDTQDEPRGTNFVLTKNTTFTMPFVYIFIAAAALMPILTTIFNKYYVIDNNVAVTKNLEDRIVKIEQIQADMKSNLESKNIEITGVAKEQQELKVKVDEISVQMQTMGSAVSGMASVLQEIKAYLKPKK